MAAEEQEKQMKDLPVLPYTESGGVATSGWSGSDTSRERAIREDKDGTTTRRQRAVLSYLRDLGTWGATWIEVAARLDLHHGQATGTLSGLHKEGHVARLAERRGRCAVYVLPENVDGRETRAQGRRRQCPRCGEDL